MAGRNRITVLAFLDLAAKAGPRRAEGTFFALLMAIYNVAAWMLIPLVRIDRIEAMKWLTTMSILMTSMFMVSLPCAYDARGNREGSERT